jgi:hypothetical protein
MTHMATWLRAVLFLSLSAAVPACKARIISGESPGDAAGTTCGNGVKDGNEAGVDCGGDCPTCAVGSECARDGDCVSGVCIGDLCRGATCTDGAMNGDETGVDCGGTCGICPGSGCTAGSECASGVCASNSQCADAICTDGVKNGDETGVDCGGRCALPANGARTCPVDTACHGPADCASGVCAAGICQNPTCADTVKNGDETGTDCGGSCVAEGKTCGDGTPCTEPTDCTSGLCDLICVPPHCTNADIDGGETDLNCGGPDCAPCADGSDCTAAGDCLSGVCGVANSCVSPPCQCQAPACDDGLHNGDETGVDCGGSCALVANGSKTCGPGVPCTIPGDCTSGACDVTCQPSCSDGVLNQDERGIDCGGTCLLPANGSKTCPAGAPCGSPADCTSGFCNGTCMASSCSPPDGLLNGTETDTDCGGIDCPGCAPGADCVLDTDCAAGFCNPSSVCQTASCGDGIKAGTELCDDNDTPYPTISDDALDGMTCTDFFFTGGDLVCSPTCTFDLTHCTGGCGNGVLDTGEQCDGATLNGQTCGSLGYAAGPGLACNSACGLDVSSCTSTACPTCPVGAYCSASTDFLCRCPLYETACSTGCTSLLNDPASCGSCGHACTGGAACVGGECLTSCPTPLVKCGARCVDVQTDSTYCGAVGDCSGANNGADCVVDYNPDRICLSGACVSAASGQDFTNAGDAPTRCLGGGPVLNLNTGLGCDPLVPDDPDCVVSPALGCTGDLAAVTFRYALCSCTDINTSHPLFADGFNSATGPYGPHCEDGAACIQPGSDNGQCTSDANGDGHRTCADQKGAGVGANGTFSDSQLTTVWGTMWLSSGTPATYPNQSLPNTTIEQELHVGGTLSGGTARVRGNGYVVGSITATGSFDGKLYQSSGKTSTMTAGSIDRTANPLVVPEACDCSSSKLIDVAGIVDAHVTNNNNADIGLSSTLMSGLSGDVRLDLPCGMYYFNRITAGNNTTVSIVAHGRTAIFIGENIDIPKILNITLTDSAELDVFVKGGVCNNGTIYVGSPSYPARVRFYVGGGNLLAGGSGTTCGSDQSRAMSLRAIVGAANMYAPYGEVYMPQPFTLYGSILAGRAYIVQTATFHFDTGIVAAGETCDHCGDGVVDPGEECDDTALGGKTCADLGYTGGPLACSPVCTFDTRACCGDGVRGGVEQCDGTDLNSQTCASLGQTGTLACSPACTFQGCTGGSCDRDGVLDAGEACDDNNTAGPGDDVFPPAQNTCAEVLGLAAAGTVSCSATCQIVTSGCTWCGDGIKNGSEACDGADFGGTRPTCSAGSGVVSCSASCALDTSTCVGCTSCRDCNNQACVAGVCGQCLFDSECCIPFMCVSGVCQAF